MTWCAVSHFNRQQRRSFQTFLFVLGLVFSSSFFSHATTPKCAAELKLSTVWQLEDRLNGVWYMSAEERNLIEIRAERDRPLYAELEEFLSPGLYLFVIGTDQKIYALPQNIQDSHFHSIVGSRPIQHSTIFGYSPVRSAGEFWVSPEGTISLIGNRSGHYMPDLFHLLQSLEDFQKILRIPTEKLDVTVHLPNSLWESLTLPFSFFQMTPPFPDDTNQLLKNMVENHTELLISETYGLDYAKAAIFVTKDTTDPIFKQAIALQSHALIEHRQLRSLANLLSYNDILKYALIHLPDGDKLVKNYFLARIKSLSRDMHFIRKARWKEIQKDLKTLSQTPGLSLKMKAWLATQRILRYF